MIKKISFLFLAFLASVQLNAQTEEIKSTCGTPAPGDAWDNWFNSQVEKVMKTQAGKGQVVNYTIPVIVHVIHFGENVGTFPNIDSNQIYSQIQVLNADFAGRGTGTVNVPSYFSNLIANTGIRFCMAQQNPQGTSLTERGIDRVSAIVNAWQSPATPTLNLRAYFNTVIIPATIWDPTKYLNIWVSDKPISQTFNGFATYPTGTGLTGLFGGSFGTPTNDGIWCWAKAFGTVGTVSAPFNQGRTATHELGHWLGLRHTWGDGNCLSDYVNDTPYSKQANTGCVTSTLPDMCGINLSPNGEMPMNFMDNTDDLCKYMFTPGQNIRIQTTMSQCVNRNLLGSHALCNATTAVAAPASSAIASFNFNSGVCVGSPFTPFNASSGNPNPNFIWSSSPAASFSPAATVPNPAITFNNPGNYTLSLVATNSISSSTYTMLVTASGTCSPFALCLDSAKMIRNVDTLTNLVVGNNPSIIGCQTGFAGFLTGTNCYKDKAFAQYFPPNTYSNITFPQVNSAIVFFDSTGTKGNGFTPIVCKVYGGSVGNGPGAVVGSKSENLSSILSSPKTVSVSYLGRSGYVIPNRKMIPYTFNFASPVIVNGASGFFVGIDAPLSPSDSIRIVSSTRYNNAVDSSAWYLNLNNTWRTYRYNRSAKIQLAIIPLLTCSPAVGLKENQIDFGQRINIMPNPSTGVFNLIFALPKETEVEIQILNSMGQVISTDKINHVSNNVFDVDLSSKSNGVYFIYISSGGEKTVKKIIVNH